MTGDFGTDAFRLPSALILCFSLLENKSVPEAKEERRPNPGETDPFHTELRTGFLHRQFLLTAFPWFPWHRVAGYG